LSLAQALAVIVNQGIAPLKDGLINESEDHIKAACAWSLGQIGRHTPGHAQAIAQADVFRHLIAVYNAKNSSADLKRKAQIALKSVLQKCQYLPALEPLLQDTPEKILKYVVHQFAKVLPNNPTAKKSFVQARCLQRIQELKADDKTKLHEYIQTINACFPEDIVQYYSPNYSEKLLKKLDEFEAQR